MKPLFKKSNSQPFNYDIEITEMKNTDKKVELSMAPLESSPGYPTSAKYEFTLVAGQVKLKEFDLKFTPKLDGPTVAASLLPKTLACT